MAMIQDRATKQTTGTDQVGKGRDDITHQKDPVLRRRDRRREGVAAERSWLDSLQHHCAKTRRIDWVIDILPTQERTSGSRVRWARTTGKRSFLVKRRRKQAAAVGTSERGKRAAESSTRKGDCS